MSAGPSDIRYGHRERHPTATGVGDLAESNSSATGVRLDSRS